MSRNHRIRKAAVLGSGVMGGAIAAHLANAGVPVLLLDIVPPTRDGEPAPQGGARNQFAAASLKALSKVKPPPLFSAARAGRIEIGNFEDDLHRVSEADWIIEVVREDIAIKEKLLSAVAPHIHESAILSSNTSGLSLEKMSSFLPEALRPRFLGTHFFNPPRYMKLLEIIATARTAPEVVDFVVEFGSSRLGKGIVHAKDTPNFVANRIGVHGMMIALRAMEAHGLGIEEIDALTGPPLGRPRTGTFRLADMVGLDTLLMVAGNVRDNATGDESLEVFTPPGFLTKMVEAGRLGMKSRAGFYRKDGKQILVIDPKTLEYAPAGKPDFPELAALKRAPDAGTRIRTLIESDGRGAKAAWALLAPTLVYSAARLGEIADDGHAVDSAMRLGFNWELGPFEVWDALGFRPTVERLRADGYTLPAWVDRLYADGAESLYREVDGTLHAPVAVEGTPSVVPTDPRVVDPVRVRASGGEVRANASASLVDLGRGVLGLEFHSKMNAIDGGTIEMIAAAADEAERNWQALVVANSGENFSAGANLMLIVEQIRKSNWDAIDEILRGFQGALDRLEQCGVPVVVAPHARALGGGCEVVLGGNAVRAAAESYIGLVEIGAGVVPAGGGCMRLYRRLLERHGVPGDLYPVVRRAFETVAMGKVSGSADEARDMGFLRPQDSWSMNGDHRIADAVDRAVAMAGADYEPPQPERALPVMGRDGLAVVEMMLVNLGEGRFASPHDAKIGRELGRIFCGGETAGPTAVAESYLLELERESFLRLCGEKKTVDRMVALLETGKPLRN